MYVVDLPGRGDTRLHDRDFGWNLAAMTGLADLLREERAR